MYVCMYMYFNQVSSATLTSLHRSGMEGDLLDMMSFPIYFEYENGVVGRVYVIENDSIFCTNIKKGIISMFQVQTEAGERMEVWWFSLDMAQIQYKLF